jgi:hypothetical protein
MTAKSAAILIGLIFIVVGILGFVENPIIGDSPDAIFHADSFHNYVHIGSGILFLLFAMAAPATTRGFMVLFGLVYLTLGVIGYVTFGKEGTGKVLGVLHVNANDNYLHIALGLVIVLMAFVTRKTS